MRAAAVTCRLTGPVAMLSRPRRPAASTCAGHPAPRRLPSRCFSTPSATSPRTAIDADVAPESGEEDEQEDLAAQLTSEELEMIAQADVESGAPPAAAAAAAAAGDDDDNEDEDWAGDEDDADEGEDAGDYDGEGNSLEDDDVGWAAAASAAAAPDGGGGPSSPPDLASAADPADAAAADLALALAAAASATKAGDVTVLHVAPLVYWTSYLVLATVYSRPQLSAVLAKAEAAAAAPPHSRDLSGSANPGKSSWEALDFGDVVMHVLTPAQREFYDIDGFYGAAEEVPLPGAEGGGAGASGGSGEWSRRLDG